MLLNDPRIIAFPQARGFAAASTTVNYGSPDHLFEKDRINKAAGEENTRDFTYFTLGGARFIYASTARLALIKVDRHPRPPLRFLDVGNVLTCVWNV